MDGTCSAWQWPWSWPSQCDQDKELMQLVDQELADFELHLAHKLRTRDTPNTSPRKQTPSRPEPPQKPDLLTTIKRERVDHALAASSYCGSSSSWPSQIANAQLKLLVQEQVALAHEMQQLVNRQVNRDLAFWLCHETRMNGIANGHFHQQEASMSQRRSTTSSENDIVARLVEEAQVFMMLQRVDSAFQQMDLVFQQHLATAWQADAFGSLTFSRVRLRCALPKDYPTSSGTWSGASDYAELVGCAMAHFDAGTLLELIWKCFANRDDQGCSKCGSSMVDNTAVGDRLAWKKQHTATIRSEPKVFACDEVSSSTTDPFPPSLCEEFRNTVTDNVIRVNGHIEFFLPEETFLEVDVKGALKKYSNAIVIDSMGKAALSAGVVTRRQRPLQQHQLVEFTRSAWLRVEALDDGRSLLRHVYRMWPVTSSRNSIARETVQDLHIHHQEQLQLMGQLLQRAHAEMSNRVEQIVKQQYVAAHDHGQWWMHNYHS